MKMLFLKALLSLLLVFSLLICPSFSVNATSELADTEVVGIKCMCVDNDVIEYATNVFPKHIHAFHQSDETTKSDDNEYFFGEPFSIINVEVGAYSWAFPVINHGQLLAVLEVANINNEYCSSLSTSFIKELDSYLLEKAESSFVLLTNGTVLQAYNGSSTYEIYSTSGDKDNQVDLLTKFDPAAFKTSRIIGYNNLHQVFIGIESSGGSKSLDGPTSYKTLSVGSVIMSGTNTCWAVVCAEVINYLTSYTVSCFDVAYFIYGYDYNHGANWSQMQQAYNHWGLYPTQTTTVSFSTIKSNINNYKPMHLRVSNGSTGHSLALIGYEDWTGSPGGTNDKILIFLDPYSSGHYSVTLNSSGNFNYAIGLVNYSWVNTIKF